MLLVAGALAGARSLNELVVEAFGEVGPAILHISGERDYESLQAPRAAPRLPPDPARPTGSAPPTRRPTSCSRARAARSGRSPRPGKPAILVPYPFATADHQAKNAEYFVRAGGAIMVRDLDLDDVPDLVRSLLDDPPRLARMGEAMLARRAARTRPRRSPRS